MFTKEKTDQLKKETYKSICSLRDSIYGHGYKLTAFFPDKNIYHFTSSSAYHRNNLATLRTFETKLKSILNTLEVNNIRKNPERSLADFAKMANARISNAKEIEMDTLDILSTESEVGKIEKIEKIESLDKVEAVSEISQVESIGKREYFAVTILSGFYASSFPRTGNEPEMAVKAADKLLKELNRIKP
jgi:hypothetical protein